MAMCRFTLLPCPKQCKMSDEINHFMRKDLDDHLEKYCPNRDYKCQYCGEEGTFAVITEIHDKSCDEKTVICPNTSCMKIMERRTVNEHVKSECEYTVIPCKYESIGCAVKMKRQDMAAHEQDDKVHLHMTLETTLQLKKDNETLKSDNEKLKSHVTELRRDLHSAINILQLTLKAEPQTYKLTDYQKKKDNREVFTFPPFYTHPRGYHMTLTVDANAGEDWSTHVSVFARVVKGEFDTKLKWPLLGSVTFVLLNQLEDKNHVSKTLPLTKETNLRVNRNLGYHFILHSALGYNPAKNTQYLKDDILYFRMSVEL